MPCAGRHCQAPGIEFWLFPFLGVPPLSPAPPARVPGRPSHLPAVTEEGLAVPAWALALPSAEVLPAFSFLMPTSIPPGTLVDPPSLWGLLSLLPILSPEEGPPG